MEKLTYTNIFDAITDDPEEAEHLKEMADKMLEERKRDNPELPEAFIHDTLITSDEVVAGEVTKFQKLKKRALQDIEVKEEYNSIRGDESC